MSGNISQILESHHCYLEVSPYYIVAEDRPVGAAVTVRKIHAGFDLDIYGVKMGHDPNPPAEYWLVYDTMREIADAVRHEHGRACSVEVIPFGSTIVLDTRNHLQPMALLRIRVAHSGDIHEAAGAPEHEALKAIEAQLSALGLTMARSRA